MNVFTQRRFVIYYINWVLFIELWKQKQPFLYFLKKFRIMFIFLYHKSNIRHKYFYYTIALTYEHFYFSSGGRLCRARGNSFWCIIHFIKLIHFWITCIIDIMNNLKYLHLKSKKYKNSKIINLKMGLRLHSVLHFPK